VPAHAEWVAPDDPWQLLLNSATTSAFYGAWLTMLCASLSGVEAALLLVRDGDGTFLPAATWPNASLDATHLGAAIERVLKERTSVLVTGGREEGPQGASVARVHIGHPITAGDELIAVVALDLKSPQQSDWREALEKVRWGSAWPEALHWRLQALSSIAGGRSAQLALDLITIADQHDEFRAAAILVAGALAERLDCERVSLGLLGGKGISVKAISHSAAFDRRSELVSGLQGVMEEAFDQRSAVSVPPCPLTERRISVAHADFMKRWSVGAIASVLITSSGRPVGVFTLERRADRPFDEDTLRACMLAVERVGPLLEAKYRQERLLSGRLVQLARKSVKAVVGGGRPSLRIAAVLAALAVAGLAYWPMPFRVAAKVNLEGSVQRAAVVPFDGFVAEARVRAGDVVSAGQLLVRLDDRDLLLDKLRWEAERQKLIQRQREAFAKHDRAALQVVSAQIEQAESQLELAIAKLERSHIRAPIGGVIVSGDLSKVLGTPVTQGKTLFELAPLDAYRVVLHIDEHDIRYVKLGQGGMLLLAGAPAAPLPLMLTKLVGVATVENGRNVFRAEANLTEQHMALRPGMEGLAKIEVDHRSALWIWTRPLVDRIRLLVWNWLP
jgi:biotin carboxyl carrier protein